VEAGLRQELERAASTLPRSGPVARLRVTMDDEPSTAVSLHVFRRRPWPATLVSLPVRRAAFARMAHVPAAGSLATTSEAAFAGRCDG
jgi:hypothetical protein